jgi:uncharacterized protein YjiS (DUF1127 family)
MIMNMISSAPHAVQGITVHPLIARIAATLEGWWVAFITWRLEQAVIHQLGSMSDLALKDMGLSRSEIVAAVKGDPTRSRGSHRYLPSACTCL